MRPRCVPNPRSNGVCPFRMSYTMSGHERHIAARSSCPAVEGEDGCGTHAPPGRRSLATATPGRSRAVVRATRQHVKPPSPAAAVVSPEQHMLEVNPEEVIEEIRVHPECDDAFCQTVVSTVRQFAPILKPRFAGRRRVSPGGHLRADVLSLEENVRQYAVQRGPGAQAAA